jgi:hypothetical protein
VIEKTGTLARDAEGALNDGFERSVSDETALLCDP